MVNSMESINIKLKHDYCWGTITNFTDVKIRTLTFKKYLKESLILGIISIRSNKQTELSNFLDKFKNSKTIYKIVDLRKTVNTWNLAFFERGKDMTANIISNYPVLSFSQTIYNGLENWKIILPKMDNNSIKQDMSNFTTIIEWNSEPLKRTLLSLYKQLTEIEFITIQKAEELGYFSYPREINLDELSYILGISKQATSVTLRRAIKKIICNNL